MKIWKKWLCAHFRRFLRVPLPAYSLPILLENATKIAQRIAEQEVLKERWKERKGRLVRSSGPTTVIRWVHSVSLIGCDTSSYTVRYVCLFHFSRLHVHAHPHTWTFNAYENAVADCMLIRVGLAIGENTTKSKEEEEKKNTFVACTLHYNSLIGTAMLLRQNRTPMRVWAKKTKWNEHDTNKMRTQK